METHTNMNICAYCGIETNAMYDAYICITCRNNHDPKEVIDRFEGLETAFTRSIPELVRRDIFREAGGLCQYCFVEDATEIDHIIPYSFIKNHSPDNLIASCMSCNRCVSNKMFYSLSAKREYIQDRQLKKAKRQNIAIWTWAELQELSYTLRGGKKIVVGNLDEAKRLYDRLMDMGFKVRM